MRTFYRGPLVEDGDNDGAVLAYEPHKLEAVQIMINVRWINDTFRNLGTVNEKGERSEEHCR